MWADAIWALPVSNISLLNPVPRTDVWSVRYFFRYLPQPARDARPSPSPWHAQRRQLAAQLHVGLHPITDSYAFELAS